jgi:hypothetical protein
MKLTLILALTCASFAASAHAQDRQRPTIAQVREVESNQPTPAPSMRRDELTETPATGQTPEMWFYQQERNRWEDPKEAVRRHAEFRAAQRSSRIAAMQWYGMSNSRPQASVSPHTSSYSPTWGSSSYDPYRWSTARDTSATTVIVR